MDKIANHLPPTSPGKTSSTSNVTARNVERESKERMAKRAAFSILSCYRKSDTDDPATYVEAITRVLVAYPDEVVRAIADPLTGIAGEQTFLPSIAELRASLDRRYLPIISKQRRDEEIARTRRFIDEGPAALTAEQRARAVDRWENTKTELRGGVARSQEQTRQDAEKHLAQLYATRNEPIAVRSQQLSRMLRMGDAP